MISYNVYYNGMTGTARPRTAQTVRQCYNNTGTHTRSRVSRSRVAARSPVRLRDHVRDVGTQPIFFGFAVDGPLSRVDKQLDRRPCLGRFSQTHRLSRGRPAAAVIIIIIQYSKSLWANRTGAIASKRSATSLLRALRSSPARQTKTARVAQCHWVRGATPRWARVPMRTTSNCCCLCAVRIGRRPGGYRRHLRCSHCVRCQADRQSCEAGGTWNNQAAKQRRYTATHREPTDVGRRHTPRQTQLARHRPRAAL